jgi:Tfp pilus assembly protein PilN
MVDMHKEIKLSDLFKRGSKERGEGANGKAPEASKEPKAPKPPKERRRWRGEKKEKEKEKEKVQNGGLVAAHEAPPPADVPLMRAFNLLPREEVRAEREGGAPSPMPYVLVGLVGALLFAALAAFYLMAGTDVTKKRGQAEDLRAELAAYQASAKQPSVDDKAAALAAERLGRTNALSAALIKRLAWDRLLREIALVVPDEVSLSQIQGSSPTAAGVTANADGSPVTNLTIIGTTLNEGSVAEFMTRLSVIPELSAVQLKEAGDSPTEANRVVFTIAASLRSGS